jgi:hypothetical protein
VHENQTRSLFCLRQVKTEPVRNYQFIYKVEDTSFKFTRHDEDHGSSTARRGDWDKFQIQWQFIHSKKGVPVDGNVCHFKRRMMEQKGGLGGVTT